MSLTTFIKELEVRNLFLKYFKKPEFTVKVEIKAKVITRQPMLVGTAFDYLLRFMVKRSNPETVEKPWVAENALTLLHDKKSKDTAKSVIQRAKGDKSDYLKTGNMNRDVITSAIKLAQLDGIFRSNNTAFIQKVGVINEEDVEDLANIISITPTEIFKAKSFCFLNPTFGSASYLVGGADADLVIDDALIDIKTTKEMKLTSDVFNQLIGYTALTRLGSIDDKYDGHNIRNVCVYFSRHGYLHKMPVDTFSKDEHFSEFVREFEKLAIKRYGDLRLPGAYEEYVSRKVV